MLVNPVPQNNGHRVLFEEKQQMNKPLSGIRILDLTHMLSGPYGAMILADLGADTIKVEPLHGEGTRKLLATDPGKLGQWYGCILSLP